MTPRLPSQLPLILALAALVSATATAGAQTVYRCGPQRNVYSQQPCTDGQAVDVDDTRSADQHRDAEKAAKAEARQAAQLRNERREREAADAVALRGQRPAGIRGVPELQPSASKIDAWRKSGKDTKPKKPRSKQPGPMKKSPAASPAG